jgi:uncharacterized protein YfaS (alpha-2-macroglobulin family)
MVLALDYMQQTKQIDAELEKKARDYVAKGYERLLGFEVKSEPGGFDWWGKPPANLFLSAYGLMEFLDIAKVHPIDPALPGRIMGYLRKHQAEDGSWTLEGQREPWSIQWKKSAFNMTAYIAWALGRADAHKSPGTKKMHTQALEWLRQHLNAVEDPYGLALAAHAFHVADPKSKEVQELIAELLLYKTTDEHGIKWSAATSTFVGGRGLTGEIETTALVALLLIEEGRHTDVASQALERLAKWRGPDGRYGSTHSTVLALKALLAAAGSEASDAVRVAKVLRDGVLFRELKLEPHSTQPLYVDLGTGDPKRFEVQLDGEGRVRTTLRHTVWEKWPETTLPSGPLDLAIAWPAESLRVGEDQTVKVKVTHRSKSKSGMVILEIGLPPGCHVDRKQVVGDGLAEAELSERHLVLYLDPIAAGGVREFTFLVRPKHAFKAQTAHSRAYEYYVEHEQTVRAPQKLEAK